MHPALKILVGAVMVGVGVFMTITYWSELLVLVKGGLGPLLVLVGAFIVWLESDEWKMNREEKNSSRDVQQQFQQVTETVQEEDEDDEEPSMNYEEVLSGTVDEVKDRVRDMDNPNVEKLIEKEKDGKNRVTVIQFLERRL